MKVHLKQIPAEGIHLEGKEETDILELEEDQIKPLGPVEYSLDIGVSESGLFVTGRIWRGSRPGVRQLPEAVHLPGSRSRICGSTRTDRTGIGRLDAVDSRGYSPRSSSSSALRLGPEDEVCRTTAEVPERRRRSQRAKCLGRARPFEFEPKEVS